MDLDLVKLVEFHLGKKAEATLALSSATQGNDYGNVGVENDRITFFAEKSERKKGDAINAGIYCFNTDLWTSLPSNEFLSLEEEILPSWVRTRRVFGFLSPRPVTDIGTLSRYREARKRLATKG